MFDKAFAKTPSLTIRGVNTYAVEVPMTFPLGTSAAIVKNAPLLLVDLETEEGITGHSYVFCYRSSVPRAIDAVLRDAISVKSLPIPTPFSRPIVTPHWRRPGAYPRHA